ncbi:MAG TPA: protease-like activity factor CPAF [Elusimicrobia bacterium]|nr:protease-like activity factor CPAF [Elusimicrobiota bacterium]
MTGAYTDGILMIYGPLFCGVRYLSFACKETIVTHTKWMRFGVWLILSSVPSANAGAAGSLNQLESLGGLSSENYGQVFDGSPRPAAAGLSIPGTGGQPGSRNQQDLRQMMLKNLDFIENMIRVQYAPAGWKKEQYNWDLDAEMQKARNSVAAGNITVEEYHKIVKRLLSSTRDYHVNVQFTRTEAASLPFAVMEADGRYLITWVNRAKLPLSSFPFKAGDELVAMDGKPAASIIQELKSQLGESSALTDSALASMYLTRRRAGAAMNVTQGPVILTVKPAGSESTTTRQLIWDYTPEQILYKTGSKSPAKRKPLPIPLAWLDDASWHGADGLQAAGGDPFKIGARESFVPALGELTWESAADAIFRAYIYRSPVNGKLIGYIRIPSYSPDDTDAAVAEFAAVMTKFNAGTDGLVIDEVNNPGGSVFYLYTLVSMLTDQVMATPRHQIALTQDDLVNALEYLKLEPQVKTDEDAKKVLGDSLSGYPVSYEVFRHMIEFSRFVIKQWNSGKRFTDLTYLHGVDYINPSNVVQYKKPVMVLVNELDFSGGDFFPAILQDNKRAVIFGTRTSGAGGVVKSITYPNQLGISGFSLTGSIARRVDGNPIENLGITPDVTYARTAADLQNGFKDYAAAVNNTMAGLLK